MLIDTIVISVVPHCNLQCTYCQNEIPLRDYHESAINLNLFKHIVSSYKDIASEEKDYPVLRFCFSGGEPLLAGQKFFEEIAAIQHTILDKNFRIKNIIQTNGTLLSEKWCQLFRSLDFSVSVSIDGPPDIHNRQRRFKQSNNPSLLKVISGLECLKENGIPYGTLTVVTKNSLGQAERILDFLASMHPKGMAFLPCVDRGPSLNSGEFGGFMVELFDAWVSLDNPTLPVREFHHILNGMLNLSHTKDCQFAGDCPRHINVAPDGKVSACDQYIGKPEGYLGDLSTESLREILSSERYIKFRSRALDIPEECTQCRYLALCNGGCPYRREPKNTLDYFCEDRKMLFGHIENYLDKQVYALYNAALRCGVIQEPNSDGQDPVFPV